MIDPADLTENDVGKKVIYINPMWNDNQEEGTLTSWNEKFVFVKFKGPNGEACYPEDVWFAL